MKQTVIITRGLPASGKTTWSRAWIKKHPDYKRINRDDLRMMIYEGAWNNKKEEAVLAARMYLIWTFLNKGYNLVLDDTNLDPRRLQETTDIIEKWASKNKEITVDVKIQDFTKVPLDTCLERNSKRVGITKVPDNFIKDYYKRFIKEV
jgi:predicted kinase